MTLTTRRLLLRLLVAIMAVSAARAASVAGRVVLQGRGGGAEDPSVAVVWLQGGGGGAPSPERATIDMRRKTFRPEVVAVPVGSSVSFPNADPILHNVFSVSSGNQFDLGLYGQGDGRSVVFREPGVVRIFCNVHPQMEAFVVVTPDRAWATVGADGSFLIENVLPGRYDVTVWDVRGGLDSRAIDMSEGGTVQVEFVLDASSYRRQAHLDKDGRPYTGRERY